MAEFKLTKEGKFIISNELIEDNPHINLTKEGNLEVGEIVEDSPKIYKIDNKFYINEIIEGGTNGTT